MISLYSTQHRKKATLDDIFAAEDVFGLLDVVALKPKAGPTDLIESQFENIMTFVDSYGRAPQNTPNATMSEKSLTRQLNAIRVNPEQCKILRERDRHGLLADVHVNQNLSGTPQVELASLPEISKSELVTSLDDIFADDDLGLLDFDAPEIFTIKHVPVGKKDLPDEIARRQPCPDFERFSPLFARVHRGFRDGVFSVIRYRNEHKFQEGDFFILSGVMGYVHRAGERLEQYDTYNARLHLVFENGTELNMLYQSLTQGLVRDNEGRKVDLNGQQLVPSDGPVPSGFVYVLATRSTDPALTPYIRDLYKIGFTETTVEKRIQNAAKDRTFLEAPVRIIFTTQCFNMNANRLEALVHGFLAKQRLNITLRAANGSTYTPREWFHTPLATVQAVIKYILDGTISEYRMDNTTGKIVTKKKL
ncbi:T5orf172 domain [Serratia entomophila]|uniref:Sea11 n=1 Tax=Serratia entomophila TaxID=42906 RepID=Q7BQU9_9GAMM|nr:GIY-YIG nuclease family protein [Serratia entomophila]AAR13137.1 Sea11 [Serratia entomophila]UIW20850.1 GIY-YIG nuclease family protein [Serratia entomophila]ULG11116.1 Sea11 [Serratia entomophila]ULG11438.1 Sea11 [Serratia entomophila]ULG12226.1 Sea11 [Serratia entomophila]